MAEAYNLHKQVNNKIWLVKNGYIYEQLFNKYLSFYPTGVGTHRGTYTRNGNVIEGTVQEMPVDQAVVDHLLVRKNTNYNYYIQFSQYTYQQISVNRFHWIGLWLNPTLTGTILYYTVYGSQQYYNLNLNNMNDGLILGMGRESGNGIAKITATIQNLYIEPI